MYNCGTGDGLLGRRGGERVCVVSGTRIVQWEIVVARADVERGKFDRAVLTRAPIRCGWSHVWQLPDIGVAAPN